MTNQARADEAKLLQINDFLYPTSNNFIIMIPVPREYKVYEQTPNNPPERQIYVEFLIKEPIYHLDWATKIISFNAEKTEARLFF